MTYKHYILKHGFPDTKETYKGYLEQYNSTFPHSEKMQQQYIDATYIYRFAIQYNKEDK